jgi:hypothetical protein
MTAETVREEFGAPTEADLSGDAKSRWTYWHEEREWCSDPPSALWLLDLVLFPATILSIPVNAAVPGVPWDLVYVTRTPVVLHFEAEKLVRWELLPDPTQGAGGTWSHQPDDSLFGDWHETHEAQAARYKAMKRAVKRLGESGLSEAERSKIKHYYKKVKKNPNMSAGEANKIKKKIKKVGQ